MLCFSLDLTVVFHGEAAFSTPQKSRVSTTRNIELKSGIHNDFFAVLSSLVLQHFHLFERPSSALSMKETYI